MDTLSWILNFVPWWLWVGAVVVLIAVFWQVLGPIWLLTPRWLKTALAAVGAVLAAYIAGRNRGSKDERDQRAKADARAVQTRKDTDDEIRNLSPSDTDKRLDAWNRD